MTLAALNGSDRTAFVGAIGWVFEHSPWVAERAWAGRPFATVDALHAAMAAVVAAAGGAEQLALLRAHPDLGARVAMTTASSSEQAAAGLDRLSTFDRDRLLRLTAAYHGRFGFPFILAVAGATPAVILEALERRVESTPEHERTEALAQVARIARGRLDEAIA